MFVDPIDIAADSPTPALSFSVVTYTPDGAERKDVTNGYSLILKHSQTPAKGERHYMQLTQTVSATNPLTGGTSLQTAAVSLSVSIPSFGWTQAQKAALVKALDDVLTDSQVTIVGFLNYNS